MARSTEPNLQPARQPNLVLIGYRATGKTSVGARLAEALHCPFVDLDQVLVREAGRSVADIVAQDGWDEFRRLEKELVARYRDTRGLVLATGGGVILDPDNVAALRKNGILIWLTAEPAAIQARLAQDQPRDANRPSLTGADTVQEVRGSAGRACSPLSGCGPDERGHHAPVRLPGGETGAGGPKI